MRRVLCGLLICCGAICVNMHGQPTPVYRPRVVVVTYFEVGQDTGDRPGELQYWVERDGLTRTIDVPGMTHPVRANADASEIAVTVGPGNIKPGVNLMALGADPRFDLHRSYWLINGIAGVSPADGTIGDAFWTDFVINGDLTKEIDARELPAGWKDGYFSLDGTSFGDAKGGAGWEDDVRKWGGNEARANRRGNVIRMNAALLKWAYGLTRNVPLSEDAAMRSLRAKYGTQGPTGAGPRVRIGANLAAETFWHGAKLDAWAHRWVTFETDSGAGLGTTAMNDSGALLALQTLTIQRKADWNRALLLRTASNFDMPPPGMTAAQDLAAEQHGAYTAYLPALEAAYAVGHKVVSAWMSQPADK
jgi:purine nucleoside permease